MKKRAFNDTYGMEQAVLSGEKTMMRCVIKTEPATMDVDSWKDAMLSKSMYKVGEIVAVSQSYEHVYNEFLNDNSATGRKYRSLANSHQFTNAWTNKTNVNARHMPHRIRITSVNIERLQDISDEDCKKEGIFSDDYYGDFYSYFDPPMVGYRFLGSKHFYEYPRGAFSVLIDKLKGDGTWKSNPYVYVYEFELFRDKKKENLKRHLL